MTLHDAAKLLGVDVFATEHQIKTAYRRYALRTHPDVRPGDAAASGRMVAGNQAYELLLKFIAATRPTSIPVPQRPVSKPVPKPSAPRAKTPTPPRVVTGTVLWSGPPKVSSQFFERRGYILRPTEDRVAFRVIARGVHIYTLVRHIDDPDVLVCRDHAGNFVTIDGVAFWFDDGLQVEPLRAEHESRRA